MSELNMQKRREIAAMSTTNRSTSLALFLTSGCLLLASFWLDGTDAHQKIERLALYAGVLIAFAGLFFLPRKRNRSDERNDRRG
jgi:hypothetical protein